MVFIFNNNEFNSIKSMEGYVMIWLLLIKSLCGFALMMLGLILALHSTEHTTVGILVMFGGLISFWSSLPSCAENRARDNDL